MARIPETELERIKRECDLAAVVSASGVVLKRHGQNLLGLCPFHEDREPSLVVTPAKQLWNCLGECQGGGSVIDWVMKSERVSFRHAVELLRNVPAEAPAAVPAELPSVVEAEAGDRELTLQVIDFYHEMLKSSPEALAYLESRGLTHPELVEHFRLGYANRTLGYRLPPRQSKGYREIGARLQRVGLLRESGHEHFTGSLIVPVFGEGGEVLEVYGRKIGERLRKGTALHLYLPGPHRGVWNREGLRGAPEVILCESLLDALTFWSAGFRHVTASYGTQGFTEDHLSAFRACGVRRVLVAYDADAAGDKAAAAVAARLAEAGFAASRVRFPRGQDANGYALAAPPASKSLALLIQTAVPLAEAGDDVLPPLSLAASQPPAAVPAISAEVRPEEVELAVGDRRYRVRGLARNTTSDALRVNLLARRGAALHVDTLDLYAARPRGHFIAQAARELGVGEEQIKKDLGAVLLKLEEIQAERLRAAETPEREAVTLSEQEAADAMALLQSPDLLPRILADFRRCGTVGEETNKLVGYLAAVSRKLERPLAVIVQSSSAAGKTSLMDAVLSFVPEEERVQYSALTGQSLFYMEGADLKHKVLAVVEEEGAEKASYALKLLQSEGELTIASTGKDPETGRLVTQEYRVEGPVMIFLTTTAVEIDEELLNRCLVLSVDEEREQTRAIHRIQRERRTLEGLLAREERSDLLQLHRNAQRLLRPLHVVNPFAPRLTFLDTRTRTRRDHEKYLTLIDSIALLHQHQRPIRTVERNGRTLEYVEVQLADIEHANRLADQVLGRSLDELAPQTRTLLERITGMVRSVCEREGTEQSELRFTRADVRAHTGWTDFQVKTHIRKLEELEYLLVHRGGPGQRYCYELLYAGEGEEKPRFLMGLSEVTRLGHDYGANPEGVNGHPEPPHAHPEPARSPEGAPQEPAASRTKSTPKPRPGNGIAKQNASRPVRTPREAGGSAAPYRTPAGVQA